MRLLLAAIIVGLNAGAATAQAYTCPMGRDPVCIDPSDKVCGMFSKCVAENAQCFKAGQCDFNGFVCKSDYDDLGRDFKKLLTTATNSANLLVLVTSCVENADTLAEAQSCGRAAKP